MNLNKLGWFVRGRLFDLTNKLRTPEGVLLDTKWQGTAYTDMYERYVVYQKRSGPVCLLYWTFTVGDTWSKIYSCGDYDTVDAAVERIDALRTLYLF